MKAEGGAVTQKIGDPPLGLQEAVRLPELFQKLFRLSQGISPAMAELGNEGLHRTLAGSLEELQKAPALCLILPGGFGIPRIPVPAQSKGIEFQPCSQNSLPEFRGAGQDRGAALFPEPPPQLQKRLEVGIERGA